MGLDMLASWTDAAGRWGADLVARGPNANSQGWHELFLGTGLLCGTQNDRAGT
jgi:hypothetical protein